MPPVRASEPPSDPTAAPRAPAQRRRTAMNRRELTIAIAVVAGAAAITLGLLVARAAPAGEVSSSSAASTPPRQPATAPASASTSTVKWSADNRVHWTGSKRNTAAFEVPAEKTVAIWMREVRPLLVVRCMANSTEAFVITDSALKIEPQTDDHTVTFSFDGETETKELWQDAEDHNALFAPDAAAFTQRMMRARTLRFGYTPHNAAPVVAEFQVNGLAPLIEPAAKVCGWTK